MPLSAQEANDVSDYWDTAFAKKVKGGDRC